MLPGKDSPSSKLLFAKDIPLYRQLVVNFYQNIQNLPQVNIHNYQTESSGGELCYLYLGRSPEEVKM